MGAEDQAPTLGLLHYVRVLRRRWYVLPAGALVGLLLAGAFLAVTPVKATAFTSIDLRVISTTPFDFARPEPELLNKTTEEQTARSPAVIATVTDELDRTVAEIRGSMQVAVIPDSTVMQIHYTAGGKEQARVGADALAAAFLEARTTNNEERVNRVLEAYDANLERLRDRLVALSAAQDGATGQERAEAEAEETVVHAQIDAIIQKRSEMAGIDTTGGAIIAAAADNSVAMAPNRPLILATGLLAGLVLGVIGAFAIDGIDRRIRDRLDVEDAGCGPILSILRGKLSMTPGRGADLDAVRSAREHILAGIPDHHSVLSIAEITGQHEPTDVAVNLAVELAVAGVTTELVLAEYPEATTARIKTGLDLIRTGSATPGVATFRSATTSKLIVHVPGPTDQTNNPSTTFVSGLSSRARLADVAPLTVIALPPHASRSLTLAAGRLSTSVVTVCISGHTSKRALTELAEELDSVNADLRGSVLLNRRRPWSSKNRRSDKSAPAEEAEADLVTEGT